MTKKIHFKPAIQVVCPYKPGKPISEVKRELGLARVIKLASNENPLGSSPKALKAMRHALKELHLYPDGGSYYLTGRLAKELGISKQHLVIGNGSNEIIELLARGFLSEGDEVLSSEGTFLVYPILSQVCGARYVTVPLKNHCYDLKRFAEKISERTRIIFIANPNNPTGTYVTRAEVEIFLKKVPGDVMVCFDEAYIDFVEARDFPDVLKQIKEGRENVGILRTFSKAYGLAGLRVGFGIFHPEVAGYLHKIRQPFNINAMAQAGALASLDDAVFLQRTRRLVFSGRRFFYREFKKMRLPYLESQANFVLFDAGRDAEKLFEALLKKGVIVRSMKAYGFPTWVRVTIGLQTENRKFLSALKKVMNDA